jgi:hypothetical protein
MESWRRMDKRIKRAGLHYHKKDELIENWRECLRSEYSPSISLNAIKDTENDVRRAVFDAAKYIGKGADMEGLIDADFKNYAEAVHGVRTWTSSGRMRMGDEEEIEEHLNDDPPPVPGICVHCGGKLNEMREVWSATGKSYKIKGEAGFNVQNINAQDETGGHVVNLHINTEGGNIYFGDVGGDLRNKGSYTR